MSRMTWGCCVKATAETVSTELRVGLRLEQQLWSNKNLTLVSTKLEEFEAWKICLRYWWSVATGQHQSIFGWNRAPGLSWQAKLSQARPGGAKKQDKVCSSLPKQLVNGWRRLSIAFLVQEPSQIINNTSYTKFTKEQFYWFALKCGKTLL